MNIKKYVLVLFLLGVPAVAGANDSIIKTVLAGLFNLGWDCAAIPVNICGDILSKMVHSRNVQIFTSGGLVGSSLTYGAIKHKKQVKNFVAQKAASVFKVPKNYFLGIKSALFNSTVAKLVTKNKN